MMDWGSIQKKQKWSKKLQEKGKFDPEEKRQGGRIAHVQEAPLPFSEAIR